MKENQHVEWKDSWRDEYLKWICGFAHAEGGELPPKWTVDKLKEKHPSLPFNPDLANAFFRNGMIEALGRGIERILDTCRSSKVPEPELRYDATGLWIVFTFPDNATQETIQEKIVALLRKTSTMTRRQMAEMLGISENGIKYHLNKLKSGGVLRHVGSTKSGHWEVLK